MRKIRSIDEIEDDNVYDDDVFLGEVQEYSSRLIRMSPDLKFVLMRNDSYVIIETDRPERPVYVNLKKENLNFVEDYFFINDALLAIPMITPGYYAVARRVDGSIMGYIDTTGYKFIFDTAIMPNLRAPDSYPQGIIDTTNGEIYDMSIKTLLHIGMKRLRLYSGDLKYEKIDKKFLLLGKPSIPAVYAQSLMEFDNSNDLEKL